MNDSNDLLYKKQLQEYMKKLQSVCKDRIPDRTNEFYQNILATCDHAYIADDGSVDRDTILNHIIDSYINNKVCMKAIYEISKYKLLEDVYEHNTRNMQTLTREIIRENGISIINMDEYNKMIDDYDLYNPGLYLCIDEKEVVAVDHQGSEVFTESLNTIDEAIAYLKIYDSEYNYEASFLTKSDNYYLQEALEDNGYFLGKEEVIRRQMIDPLYDELNVYDIKEFGVSKSDLQRMSLKELEDISQKVDIIRKTLVEISEKILNNNIMFYYIFKNKKL